MVTTQWQSHLEQKHNVEVDTGPGQKTQNILHLSSLLAVVLLLKTRLSLNAPSQLCASTASLRPVLKRNYELQHTPDTLNS